MDVSLTPELERRIAQRVESGLYENASEVVREGLRLLFRLEPSPGSRRESLGGDVPVVFDQVDRGDSVDGEAARRRLIDRFGDPFS